MKHEGPLGSGSYRRTAEGSRILGLLGLAMACVATGDENLSPTLAHWKAAARLLQAVVQGNLSLVEAALAKGANIDWRGANSLSPLLQTLSGAAAPIDASRRQCLPFLVKNGAEINATGSEGWSALILPP
jgi:hypothetical protein